MAGSFPWEADSQNVQCTITGTCHLHRNVSLRLIQIQNIQRKTEMFSQINKNSHRNIWQMTCSVSVTPERHPAIVMKIPPTLDSSWACGNGRAEAGFLGPFPANHALCKRGQGPGLDPIADSETMPHVVDSHWDDPSGLQTHWLPHLPSLLYNRTAVLSITPVLKTQSVDKYGYSYQTSIVNA